MGNEDGFKPIMSKEENAYLRELFTSSYTRGFLFRVGQVPSNAFTATINKDLNFADIEDTFTVHVAVLGMNVTCIARKNNGSETSLNLKDLEGSNFSCKVGFCEILLKYLSFRGKSVCVLKYSKFKGKRKYFLHGLELF